MHKTPRIKILPKKTKKKTKNQKDQPKKNQQKNKNKIGLTIKTDAQLYSPSILQVKAATV